MNRERLNDHAASDSNGDSSLPSPPNATAELRGEFLQDRVVHTYDGIEEYDNRLPRWWLYTLFGTIAFAFFYYFHYQVFRIGDSPEVAYGREVSAAQAVAAERARNSGLLNDDTLTTLASDPATVSKGHDLFATSCAPCHGPAGGGNIGPNLTDAFWIHRGNPQAIYTTISSGVSAKGMPAWGPQLGAERVQAVTAYVVSLRDTNVEGGKPPQGDREVSVAAGR